MNFGRTNTGSMASIATIGFDPQSDARTAYNHHPKHSVVVKGEQRSDFQEARVSPVEEVTRDLAQKLKAIYARQPRPTEVASGYQSFAGATGGNIPVAHAFESPAGFEIVQAGRDNRLLRKLATPLADGFRARLSGVSFLYRGSSASSPMAAPSFTVTRPDGENAEYFPRRLVERGGELYLLSTPSATAALPMDEQLLIVRVVNDATFIPARLAANRGSVSGPGL